MTDTSPAPVPPPAPALAHPPRTGLLWGVVSVLALGGAVLGWNAQHRLQQLEAELVKRQQDSQSQAQEARLLAQQAQDMSRDTAARAALLETRLAEVALQRGQVEDLIKAMTRSRDENLLVDIEAALRVAMQQATLTGSAEPVVAALQKADERLTRAQQPRLEPVRRAVAKDLDRLKATGVSDLGLLAIRLDEAVRLIDEVPLLRDPPRAVAAAPARSRDRLKAQPAQQAAPSASAAASDAGHWSERIIDWSHQASQTVWQEARSLIRLTRIEQPEAMLIAPEQAFFLRENVKLRLLNARLNLISRQTSAATSDIQLAQAAIRRYFDPQSRKTQLLQQLLSDITARGPQTQVPRPDDTLAALATLTGGR